MTDKNVKNRENFFITEDEVLQGLNLKKEELENIINQLENDSGNFDWEEGIQFRYVNKSQNKRDYARLGLITISQYFENQEQSNKAEIVITLLKQLNSQAEEKDINHEIVNRTLKTLGNDSDKILLKWNRHWLNFRDVRKILNTTSPRLTQAFEDIARSDLPLIIEEDFEDIEDERYYSFSGLERISRELSEKLTKKYRKLYVSRVPKVAIPIIEDQAKLPYSDQNEIERAKKEAKRRQKNMCQITGQSDSLAVHHLYNKSIYPEFASDQDNLLVITKTIHDEFHAWNEGTGKPCRINDFIDFIKQDRKYGDTSVILARLYKRKEILENKIRNRSKFLREGFITGELNTNSKELEFNNSYYKNIHNFYGKKGDQIVIDLISKEFDPYLILCDPQGKVICEDDDGGEGLNAKIQITLPVTGTYQVIATTYKSGEIGKYFLGLPTATTKNRSGSDD